MMMQRDLIIFGEDWGRLPSSSQHLAKHFAQNRKVIWVNSVGMRSPKVNLRDIRRIGEKVKNRISGPNGTSGIKPPDNLIVVEPKCLPFHQYSPVRRLNGGILASQIRRVMEQNGIRRPIVWVSIPTAESAVGHLGEYHSVYYCCDDHSALPNTDTKMVLGSEERLAQKVDAVIASSENLKERYRGRRSYFLPHGVDFELFKTAAPRSEALPEGKNIAGFYGSISDWIDQEMIVRSARALKDWTFVFIGKIETDVSRLMAENNIVLLGPRPHGELPQFSQHWDASLLPFRDTPQIRACNPLKLREYLAAGRPVVSTSFPAVTPYAKGVNVVEDYNDMIECLSNLKADDKRDTALRRELVRNESWSSRAQQASEFLSSLQ